MYRLEGRPQSRERQAPLTNLIFLKPISVLSENTSATWWSPTEDAPPGMMWIRKVVSNSPKVYRYLVDANEYHSVRCVKNP